MLTDIRILLEHGIQYVPDIRKAIVPAPFRGRPVVDKGIAPAMKEALVQLCPTKAIDDKDFGIDLGRCVFCRECELHSGGKIRFTNDHRLTANQREDLIIREGDAREIRLREDRIRPEVRRLFRSSLRLRQVSAGGDNACEMELNASGNVNFDMGRFGYQFVASPRHADGLVLTGPISRNMARALELTWEAIPSPKILILVGTDAISGGLFCPEGDLDRTFLEKYPIDLFIPGNPCHPLTFINGLLDLTGHD